MKDILDEFIATCDELRSIEHGYQFVAGNLVARANDLLEEMWGSFEGIAGEGIRRAFLEWRDELHSFEQRRDLPLELFHTYFVQAWYGFLDNLFERILENHFSGQRAYRIKPMLVTFDASQDTSSNLADNIRHRAWEYFSNKMSADQKLAVVAGALEASIPSNLKRNLRKHIMVRNMLQHNRGSLRTRDLQYLQSDQLKYPCAGGEEPGDYYNPGQIRDYYMTTYQVGDVVRIDCMVLDQVYCDFVEAARVLVP